MNEREWLKESGPQQLLFLIRHQRKSRQRRLFACACCRSVWPLLTDLRSRNAVEAAEEFADGTSKKDLLNAAYQAARQAAIELNLEVMEVPVNERTTPWKLWKAAEAAVHAAAPRGTADAAEDALIASFVDAAHPNTERSHQSMILRDIFGNPFRPVAINPAWYTWRDGTISMMAQAIYDERRFADMPVLADALEEAGCTDADILQHCRLPGEHVRGCWVVDLLLGKT